MPEISRMPRNRALGAIVVTLLLGSASHLRSQTAIAPSTTTPGAWERFAVRVAHQDSVEVDQVTVEVPDAITVLGVEAREAWSFVLDPASPTTPQRIAWKGGRMRAGEFVEFAFMGRLKGDTRNKTLVFPVSVELVDGRTLRWRNPLGAARPAPRIQIVGTTRMSPWGAMAMAGGAAGLALLALAVALRRVRAA